MHEISSVILLAATFAWQRAGFYEPPQTDMANQVLESAPHPSISFAIMMRTMRGWLDVSPTTAIEVPNTEAMLETIDRAESGDEKAMPALRRMLDRVRKCVRSASET